MRISIGSCAVTEQRNEIGDLQKEDVQGFRAAVGPDDDEDEEKYAPPPSVEEDNLKEIEHDIRSVLVRIFVLVFEDAAMITMNVRMLLKYNFTDPSIVISLMVSCTLAGAKLQAVKFIKNLREQRALLRARLRRTMTRIATRRNNK